ncbi:hypothetical protein [Clostridium botulinum]|uniref:hypothetical protein n=1 Tax=Clostridium botulinum TaxID=1491 RepID=UPI000F50448E|nr:hypothetical protein [Clostridium botulinum]
MLMNILRYKDNKLKQGLVTSIQHLKNDYNRHLGVYSCELPFDCSSSDLDELIEYSSNIKCLDEEYTEEECEALGFDIEDGDYTITGEEDIKIYLDEAESLIETTINDFIGLVQDAIQASIDDYGICISNNIAILRVTPQDCILENLCEFPDFEKEINYKNKNVTIWTSSYSEIYYMRTFFDGNFDEYNSIIMYDDLFVIMDFDKDSDVKKEEIMEIFNAYTFEIFSKHGYKLIINPKSLFLGEFDEIDDVSEDNLDINPLLFSKGMNDILMMFNEAEGYNEDRSIVEYVKVIEYISVTVVRKNVTIEAEEKLTTINISDISGEYVKELGDIFIKHNKKLKSDSELIKETIKECCDIESLSKYSPKFIGSLYNLKENIQANPSNRQTYLNCAKNDLAKSISDTRNNISHAKANYNGKGCECPDIQKKQFIVLLRNVCVQVIRWFSNSDENIRIIKEIIE